MMNTADRGDDRTVKVRFMSLQSLVHFIAGRSAWIGAVFCYLVLVAALLYGIAAHVRPESALLPVAQPVAAAAAASPAGFVDPCADVAGLERKLCKADMKIEAARARFKQRQARRQAERARPPRETVVWTPDASQAALHARGLPNRAAP